MILHCHVITMMCMVCALPLGSKHRAVQAQDASAPHQPPVSTDQVQLALPGLEPQPGGAVQPERSLHGHQHTEEMDKVKKCCCCVIM